MSKPRALPSPQARARRPAPTAPPAGPERTLQAPARAASSAVATPARGLHHDGLREAGVRGGLAEPPEVAAEQRGEVGVDRRGRAALVLAEAGQDLVRGGDVDAGQLAAQVLGDRLLVARGRGRRRAGRSRPTRRRSPGPAPPGAAALRRRAARSRPRARPAPPPRSAAPDRPAAPAWARRAGRARGGPGGRSRADRRSPAVAISAVRAPRSSSRALVPTVIPWAKDSTWPGLAPARRSTSSTASITATDWSSGVVGSFAVWTVSPSTRDGVGEGPAYVDSEKHEAERYRSAPLLAADLAVRVEDDVDAVELVGRCRGSRRARWPPRDSARSRAQVAIAAASG